MHLRVVGFLCELQVEHLLYEVHKTRSASNTEAAGGQLSFDFANLVVPVSFVSSEALRQVAIGKKERQFVVQHVNKNVTKRD